MRSWSGRGTGNRRKALQRSIAFAFRLIGSTNYGSWPCSITHGHVARALADKAGFADELSAQRATEIIYTLMSQENYGLLVVEQNWTVPAWSAWVERHLRRELFPAEAGEGG